MSEPTKELVPATPTAITPKMPSGMTEEQSLAVQTQAGELISSTMAEITDSRAVLRRFDTLGKEEQEALTNKMGLLEARVGTLLKDIDGKEQPIPRNLLELRTKLDALNPEKTMREKIFFIFPKSVRRALTEISSKYSTVKEELDHILNSLVQGRETLIEDNSELETLLKQVDIAKSQVEAKAFLGEILAQKINEKLAVEQDATKKASLEKLLHRVLTRVQDMRVMEQVNWQFDASISQTLDNNDQMIDTIDRTLAVARPLLAITLSLAVALQRQKQVVEATRAAQDSMGDMLKANATALKTQGTQITEMANQPVLAVEKIKEAYADVIQAMDQAETIRQKGIAAAQKNIAELQGMTGELQTKLTAYRQTHLLEDVE